MKLRLNEKRQFLQPVSNGINFLGYIVRRNYTLVRRRVVNNLKAGLAAFEKKLIKNDRPPYIKVVYDYRELEKLRAILASYFGHFKWADSYRLQNGLINRYRFLRRFFTLKEGKVTENFRTPGNIPTLKLQYLHFKTKFPEDIILFQVGRYYEFYEGDRETAAMLGLKGIYQPSSRGIKYGFPVRLEKVYIDKIMGLERSLTVVGEENRYMTGVKVRLPKYSLLFQL